MNTPEQNHASVPQQEPNEIRPNNISVLPQRQNNTKFILYLGLALGGTAVLALLLALIDAPVEMYEDERRGRSRYDDRRERGRKPQRPMGFREYIFGDEYDDNDDRDYSRDDRRGNQRIGRNNAPGGKNNDNPPVVINNQLPGYPNIQLPGMQQNSGGNQ